MITPITTKKYAGVALSLRTVVEGGARANAAWSQVMRVIAEEVRARRFQRELEDVQQEACIKLLYARHVTAESDTAAVAFIRKVTRNVIIDRVRRDRTRPQAVTWCEGNDPIERLPAPEAETHTLEQQEAATAAMLDRLLGEVDLQIEASGKNATMCELIRLQAHARVLARLWGKSSQEIATEIGAPDVSSACIQKWVERGLPWLLQGLDALARSVSDDPDDLRVIEQLRAALAKRRTDAGKPRQTRRKPTEVAK